MNNFDDLIYLLRYESDSIMEKIDSIDDCNGDEEKVITVLKWLQNSAAQIDKYIDEYQIKELTATDLRNKIILDYPKKEV